MTSEKQGLFRTDPSAIDPAPSHIRELRKEVAKAYAILKRKDRVDFLEYQSQVQSEAMREGDIKRLAPLETAGKGAYSERFQHYMFLRTISDEAPVVWRELRDGPYSLYLEIGDTREKLLKVSLHEMIMQGTDIFRLWTPLKIVDERELIKLRESLVEWARNRGIEADWVLDHALHTMHLWRVYDIRPNQSHCDGSQSCNKQCEQHCRTLLYSFDMSLVAFEPPPSGFSLPGGILELIASEDYLEFVRRKAVEHIKSSPILSIAEPHTREIFINSIVQKAKTSYSQVMSLITSKSSVKSAPDFDELMRDMKWAVKALVLNMTAKEIAESTNILDENTVRRAISRKLKALGLSRRMGRQKKKTLN